MYTASATTSKRMSQIRKVMGHMKNPGRKKTNMNKEKRTSLLQKNYKIFFAQKEHEDIRIFY
jgi:hypothetical protein